MSERAWLVIITRGDHHLLGTRGDHHLGGE